MTTRIVVLGAGYAGLSAANGIARQARGTTEVTLVNDRNTFTERVRMHQLAAGQTVRQRPVAELLGDAPVRFVVGRAVSIDAAAREVALSDGSRLPYDTLVYALGSRAEADAVPGAAAYGYPVADAEDAARLRARIAEHRAEAAGTVAVVGGGLTGIETATELAESHPGLKVVLLTGGTLGAALSARGRRHLLRVLARLGVGIREDARVAEVREDGAVLADGTLVPARTVVWTTGFRVPELAREAGFAVDRHGRVRVDASLRSLSHPEVYALGDAAAVRHPNGRQELRMACATGLPAAAHLARVLPGARRPGRTGGAGGTGGTDPAERTLRFRYLNRCVSLGRKDALIQYVRADDTPVEFVLTGRVAALYKEVIVRTAFAAQRRPALLPLLSPPGGARAARTGAVVSGGV
ncbi:NAD(P)/FAD-dependent oxidoreductase [Streptomyces sp. NPDC048172]|uniref:NAD(P)/FAD-dependent oxidoreductase n=1 Tax=Streptomyces sp. NPDC048172 TaxID=3365505 RepID=UPI00371095DC